MRTACMAALVIAAAALAAAGMAHAGPGSGPTAAVSMGDSYISGEAGRWQGNSLDPAPGSSGTDRACQPPGPGCRGDRSRVYVGGTDANGCHRSDVAEILSARLPVAERVNLACSGAQTKNTYRAASGGKGQNGEPPQADQLLAVARDKDVELIMLSIGGNDLGFASIVVACIQAYAAQTGPCNTSQQKVIDERLPRVTAAVIKAIDEIRGVMAEAGYQVTDYRLVLQTYPSVVPRASETRYPQTEERSAHGCPFYDADFDWARDRAVTLIGSMVKRAAAARGAEVMDLVDALQGHEVCSKTTAEASPFTPPTPAGSDWGRFAGPSTIQQGKAQEAFHPNAYGQLALGACVAQVATALPGTFACAGRAGIEPAAVALTRKGDLSSGQSAAAAPALRIRVRRGDRCLAVRVTSGRRPVRGALVRVAGRRARTSRAGRARFCGRLRARRVVVRAQRGGYRPARRVVKASARSRSALRS